MVIIPDYLIIDDTGLVELGERGLADIRNISGNFLVAEFGLTGNAGMLLNMDGGQAVIADNLLGNENRVLVVVSVPRHESNPEVLPPAYAIINAKQRDCGYPFKHLSGVGIAFKLCQALEQREPGRLPKWQELTELAALGTVADIVPLIGENRELVPPSLLSARL